jgi:hypothetical protein
VTFEAQIPEMFFCPLFDKVCLVHKTYCWGYWKLLSVVTEGALSLVNTGNLGIIESKRIQVRSSELDQRNAS